MPASDSENNWSASGENDEPHKAGHRSRAHRSRAVRIELLFSRNIDDVFPSESQIDDRLRDVSLPEHLLGNLHAVPADDEIARSLGQLDVPPALNGRIHSALTEWAIQAELTDSPGAGATVTRLHRIPLAGMKRRRRMWGWVSGVSAAATALVVQLGGVIGVVQVGRRPEPIPEMLMVVDVGPLQLTSPPPGLPIEIGPIFEEPQLVVVEEPAPEIELPLLDGAADEAWSDVAQLVDSEADLSQDMILARWALYGSQSDPEATTPVLEDVSIETPLGVEPPLIRGAYDRAFLLRENESPWLSPAAHPSLAHSRPPLTTRTHSVDLLRRLAKQGRLADEDDLRVEDFVAAQHYQYAARAGGRPRAMKLIGNAGPSPFLANDGLMLQFGVAAENVGSRPAPTHWTLVVDVSSGMAWRDRLGEARRTIARLLRELRPADRLSIVSFREDARLAAELVTREQSPQILDLIDRWEPRGRCDFAAGVRQGLSAAVEGGFEGQRRLVVLSDGRANWPRNVSDQIIGLHEQSRDLDVQWHWIELAHKDDNADDAMVQRLSAAGAEAKQIARDGHAAWALLEDWYGGSMLAAVDAQIHIRFNPRSVQFHRLVGHKASAWAGLQPIEHRIDLRHGEEATVLYELRLAPQGPSQVATATLQWKDPRSGEPRGLRRTITRADFAASFEDAAPSLQHAALAAEAGEVLSRSYFAANRSRTLRPVIATSEELGGEIAQRQDFRRFVQSLRELERIRQRRGD